MKLANMLTHVKLINFGSLHLLNIFLPVSDSILDYCRLFYKMVKLINILVFHFGKLAELTGRR